MTSQRHIPRAEVLETFLVETLSGDQPLDADELWARMAGGVQGFEFGERFRWETRFLIQAAGTYLDLFIPDPSWTFSGGDLAPLCWSRDGEVFADHLLMRTSDADPWGRADRARPRAMLREGRDAHGENFSGVRIVFPARPGRSLWLTDVKQPPIQVAASQVWPEWTPAEGLRAALVEEVAS